MTCADEERGELMVRPRTVLTTKQIAGSKTLILIKGAGDLATGVAHRLCRAGFAVLMTELARPTAIRRTVAFSEVVYEGDLTVEGLTARLSSPDDFQTLMDSGRVPVIPEPDPDWLDSLRPAALIEATLSKFNTGIRREPGRVTLALGPGYEAGRDADAVVETARGHFLGRLILEGPALPNTGSPGLVGGFGPERLIRAPGSGPVYFEKKIGQWVKAGQILGRVGQTPIVAALSGTLRGALRNGLEVTPGFKIGDIDPRPEAAGFIHSPSDKARAVAGGVLEGLLYFGLRP